MIKEEEAESNDFVEFEDRPAEQQSLSQYQEEEEQIKLDCLVPAVKKTLKNEYEHSPKISIQILKSELKSPEPDGGVIKKYAPEIMSFYQTIEVNDSITTDRPDVHSLRSNSIHIK